MPIEGIINGLATAREEGDFEALAMYAKDAEKALTGLETQLDNAYMEGKKVALGEISNVEYVLSIIFGRYMCVDKSDDKWDYIEIKKQFVYYDFDAVQNIIGYLSEGTSEPLKFTLETRRTQE